MSPPPTPEVTVLLEQWHDGEPDAFDRIVKILYNDLRALARHQFDGENRHSFGPTDLLHDALIKMQEQNVTIDNTQHFNAWAAGFMRRILIDLARKRTAKKRGGQQDAETFIESLSSSSGRAIGPETLLTLEAALSALAKIKTEAVDGPFLCRIVELHFYGGLTWAEVAKEVDVASATLYRKWELAKKFLHAYITTQVPKESPP